MHPPRWLLPTFGIVLPTLLAVGGAGWLAHPEALVLRLRLEPPAPGDPQVRLRLDVRNRIAAFVPVRGTGFSPAWRLEARAGDTWEPIQTTESETESTWLFPFQRCRFPLTVQEPGAYRAVAVTGRDEERRHYSNPLKVEAAEAEAGVVEDEVPPFTH